MSEPNQPYGGYGEPSQPYPYGQYGQSAQPPTPGTTIATPPAPAPHKSRRGLWITLSVIAAVLVLGGGGGAYAFVQYVAPATTAGTFCGYLKTQNYTAAYGLFSSGLKSQFTQDQFTQGSQALDQIEGTVTDCGAAKSGNAYSYSLGSSTATVNSFVKRATAGELDGAIHLKNENSTWKIDALDTSLLGVNLGALQAAGAFCAALQSHNYAAAYALLGSAPQAAIKQTDFVLGAQVHDQIDGNVTACGLAGLGQPNTDTNATLTVSITRSKLGAKQGAVTLDVENGAWKIAGVAPALQGTDIGPLQVGSQFCADLASSNFADAYSLLSQRFIGGATEAQIAAAFTLPAPLKYGGCTPDLTTYKVSSTSASFVAAIQFVNSSTGASGSVNFTLSFVQENGSWKLDDITKA